MAALDRVPLARAALALCIALLAACAPAAPPNGAPPARPAPASRATPEPRQVRFSAAERSRAERSLRALFSDPVFADAGIAIVAGDGTRLFTRNERRSLVPASTIKLVVAAASLATFGSELRFETRAAARAEPRDGVLPSPLWLVGSGDPSLLSSDLRAGAKVLAARGIRRIDGPLVVDATRFSGGETNPHWSPDDLRAGFAFAASALSLDGDTAELRVIPTAPGAPARIELEPPKSGVRVRGTIRTVAAGRPAEFSFERDDGARGDVRGRNVLVASGTVAAGAVEREWQPVVDVPRYAGHAFAAMLEHDGISLAGGVEVGPAPAQAVVLWSHRSPPVARLVRDMLFESNNHTAEQLLRLLPGDGFGAASDADGIRWERTWLGRWKVPLDGVRIVDGSGLSFSNRMTAASFVALLRAQLHGPAAANIIPLLPRVGMEGTVRRHTLQAGAGRVRGKSGHLQGVNGLAGVVQSRRHGPIVFAFLSNGPHAGTDRLADIEDLALDRLAEF
jgi:D-alanyl-D-alanine carboxypeptidase/D-alanyl-D-alanine-endopeptidase (penicillin-binding protein 4)